MRTVSYIYIYIYNFFSCIAIHHQVSKPVQNPRQFRFWGEEPAVFHLVPAGKVLPVKEVFPWCSRPRVKRIPFRNPPRRPHSPAGAVSSLPINPTFPRVRGKAPAKRFLGKATSSSVILEGTLQKIHTRHWKAGREGNTSLIPRQYRATSRLCSAGHGQGASGGQLIPEGARAGMQRERGALTYTSVSPGQD